MAMLRCLAAFCLLFVAVRFEAAALSNEPLPESLRSSIEDRWRSHNSYSKRVGGRNVMTLEGEAPRREISHASENENFVATEASESTALAYGRNPHYAFSLRGRRKSNDRSFEIGSFEWTLARLHTDQDSPEYRRAVELSYSPNLLLTSIGYKEDALPLLDESRFSASLLANDDNSLVIQFAPSDSSPIAADQKIELVVVTLDKETLLIREFEKLLHGGETARHVNSWQSHAGRQVITKVEGEHRSNDRDGPHILKFINEFELDPHPFDNPSAFTLSAFGLPEPPNTSALKSKFPYWIVAALGGALLIVVGLSLRRRFAR